MWLKGTTSQKCCLNSFQATLILHYHSALTLGYNQRIFGISPFSLFSIHAFITCVNPLQYKENAIQCSTRHGTKADRRSNSPGKGNHLNEGQGSGTSERSRGAGTDMQPLLHRSCCHCPAAPGFITKGSGGDARAWILNPSYQLGLGSGPRPHWAVGPWQSLGWGVCPREKSRAPVEHTVVVQREGRVLAALTPWKGIQAARFTLGVKQSPKPGQQP